MFGHRELFTSSPNGHGEALSAQAGEYFHLLTKCGITFSTVPWWQLHPPVLI